jgi:hypothetical protein
MTDSRNELPLCPNRYIHAVDSVRGKGFSLVLLRESLGLNSTAELIFSPGSNCFFLKLDDHDRWKNPRVGMLDAVSTMPFKASDIFKREIGTWTIQNIAQVNDTIGVDALIELRLITTENAVACGPLAAHRLAIKESQGHDT